MRTAVLTFLTTVALVLGCTGAAESEPAPPVTDKPPAAREPAGGTELDDGRTRVVELSFERRDRVYRVVPPDDPDARDTWPVILAFHGGGDGNTGVNIERKWVNERGGPYYLVFPDAIDGIWQARGNGGRGPDSDPLRDARFAEAVLADVQTRFGFEAGKVMATGFSNGAALVWEIMCSRSKKYDAFAPVSLGMTKKTLMVCQAQPPRSVLYIHGTGDRTWKGGEPGFKDRGIEVESAPHSLNRAAVALGCDRNATEQTQLPDKTDDGTHVVKTRYTKCSEGVRLEFLKVVGGGHTWPGQKHGADENRKPARRVSSDIDASQLILDFLDAG